MANKFGQFFDFN